MKNLMFVFLLTTCLTVATFAQINPKLKIGKIEIKLDLTIAELKVSEHPEISGKFSGTYSAQPVLKKTKGLGIGKFMVETAAFDNSGSSVQVCKKEFSFDDPKLELIEHPTLRCEITDEKKARSVIRWQTRVDTANQINENNEKNNIIHVFYPANLYIGIPKFSSDFKTIEVNYGNSCFSGASYTQLLVRFFKEGKLDKAPTFSVGETLKPMSGKTESMLSFSLGNYTFGKDPRKDNSIVIEIKPNTTQENYKNDNKKTIGLNASSAFPPSSNPCQAIHPPAETIMVTGVR